MQRILLLLALFPALSCGDRPPLASAGVIEHARLDEPLRLDGQWEFYSGRLLEPSEISGPPDGFINLPGSWNGLETARGKMPAFGCATLRLRIKGSHPERVGLIVYGPSSADRVYVNGRLAGSSGRPGCTVRDSVPGSVPRLLIERLDTSGDIEIVLHLSNFHHRKGGTWYSILYGEENTVRLYSRLRTGLDLFLAGALFIMAVYHLGIFAFRPGEYSSLLLSMLSLAVFVRQATVGEKFLALFLPVPYDWLIRFEYLSWFFASVLFIHFLRVIFTDEIDQRILVLLYAVSVIFSSVVLLAPVHLFSWLAVLFQPVFYVEIAVSIWLMVRAVKRRRTGAGLVLGGGVLLMLAVFNDILNTNEVIHTGYWAPAGLLAFLASQSLVLARSFSNAFSSVERLSVQLIGTNAAYSRFLPSEFLSQLEKHSILDVKLGDQVQKDMTVLFADIRSFTALSEKLTPQENFEFLNSYLKRVGPIIRSHGGFIDKYIGDAVMALFPAGADDAIQAAIEMQKEIAHYNEERIRDGFDPIQVGIGLHSGELILGIIGENERMDGTVISDVVNAASRIEKLTKLYGASILTTGDVIVGIEDPLAYSYRMLGRVAVKGKERPLLVVEILDAHPDVGLILGSKIEFEKGLHAFVNEDMALARVHFEEVLRINPDDRAAQLYLERASAAGHAPLVELSSL